MVDLVVVAANVQQGIKAKSQRVLAAEAITAGQPFYKDASTSGQARPAQADVLATAIVAGMAINDAATGQFVEYTAIDPDYDPGAVVVVGETYVLSAAAAGGVAPIGDLGTGDIVTILGVATATNKIPLNIINSGAAHA